MGAMLCGILFKGLPGSTFQEFSTITSREVPHIILTVSIQVLTCKVCILLEPSWTDFT